MIGNLDLGVCSEHGPIQSRGSKFGHFCKKIGLGYGPLDWNKIWGLMGFIPVANIVLHMYK